MKRTDVKKTGNKSNNQQFKITKSYQNITETTQLFGLPCPIHRFKVN